MSWTRKRLGLSCWIGRSPAPSIISPPRRSLNNRRVSLSVADDSSVDVERLAGDVAGLGRGEERDRVRDVVGLADAPHGYRRDPLLQKLPVGQTLLAY